MAKEILGEISKAINQSMLRITVTMHDPVKGVCPQCNVTAPCQEWINAKDELNKLSKEI